MHIFEELDFQETPLGEISLRKRSEPRLDNIIIYEVKMNEAFLMSSLFVEAELQLAHLGLAAIADVFTEPLEVIVGGLGLGYTAVAALENNNVATLKVIDVMQPVIDWHQRGLVPMCKGQICALILKYDIFSFPRSSVGMPKETDCVMRYGFPLRTVKRKGQKYPLFWGKLSVTLNVQSAN